jgi:hypothetical protein
MTEREHIDQAAKRYEQGKAKLFREDGSKRYSDEEHAERERGLDEEFHATLADIEEAVEKKLSIAQAVLLRHTDLGSALSQEQLKAANRRRAFFEKDAESLPLAELSRRCEAALDGEEGNIASIYLLSRYARKRATDERAADERVAYMEEYLRLEAAISRLGERLKPSEVRQAERTIEEAREIKDYLHIRRREATSPVGDA